MMAGCGTMPAVVVQRWRVDPLFSVTPQPVPEDSLLKTYRGGVHPERWGRYGDCFCVSVAGVVSLADFVFAFYTSPVFRLERLLLGLAGAPANDADALALAQGASAAFSMWYVGQRTADQLLMCDRYERTRSWFRAASPDGDRTLLQFGSAVAAASASPAQARGRGSVFRLLLVFHIVYSQLLLSAARSRVTRLSRLAHNQAR
jgi:hypothetical protein